MRFYVLDGRQYRSLYPGGVGTGADSPARHAESQSMLGLDQEAWLRGQFAATDCRWNVIAQQTVFTATPLAIGSAVVYNLDQWDGYVAARNRLLRDLVDHEVHNPIILSGDIHLAGAAAVRLDYDDPAAPDIAYEIVATSISSGFGDDLLPIFESAVPKIGWLSYANARKRGYAVCTVTAESFTTDFRVVASTLTPTSTVSTDHTDVVANRDPVIEPPTTTTTPHQHHARRPPPRPTRPWHPVPSRSTALRRTRAERAVSEPDEQPHVHTYRTSLTWDGTTSGGYKRYDRTHQLRAEPAAAGLTLSSDPAFLGDPTLLNPEQLLVAAASSCQLLSFLAVAAARPPRCRRLPGRGGSRHARRRPPGAHHPDRPPTGHHAGRHGRRATDRGAARAPLRGGPPAVLHRQQPDHRRRRDPDVHVGVHRVRGCPGRDLTETYPHRRARCP